jgi:ribonuclease HI
MMLTDSVWRARCSSYHGAARDQSGWANWIVENGLERITQYCPTFFISNFPNNTVPNRLKIVYRGDLGSSKRNDSTTRATAKYVVDRTIDNLSTGTIYAFTDGSANPNPGPAGAGAAIYVKDNNGSDSEPVAAYTAAIGYEDNNAGELYAAGLVIEHVKATSYTGNVHVFTDSSITQGALTKGWSAGKQNQSILRALKSSIRERKSIKLVVHWIPGHSGIKQNDHADALANAGASHSADIYSCKLDIGKIAQQHGFLSLTINLGHDPPD